MNDLERDSGALQRRAHAHRAFAERDINEWIVAIVRPQPGERVLDVGCGTGSQLLGLAAQVGARGAAVGIDVSPAALEAAEEEARRRSLQNVHLLEGRMEDLAQVLQGAPPFDLIVTCFALYYSQDPRGTLQQMLRYLKPAGRCFVCGPAVGNNHELRGFQRRVAASQGTSVAPPRAAGFMEGVGRELFGQLFSASEEHEFINPLTFPSPRAVLEYWRAYYLYQPDLEPAFSRALEQHFAAEGRFITRKVVRGALLAP